MSLDQRPDSKYKIAQKPCVHHHSAFDICKVALSSLLAYSVYSVSWSWGCAALWLVRSDEGGVAWHAVLH